MKTLQKLTQNEFGRLCLANGIEISSRNLLRSGKIKTLVVEHPCLDIYNVINEMSDKKSNFIPEDANAYVTSDFSPETQHLKKYDSGKEKFYSVYAIQFYYVY